MRRRALLLGAASALVLVGACRSRPPEEPAPPPEPPAANEPAPEGSDLAGRKRAAGIVFYALGTEPFWALDYHPAQGWTLREPDGLLAALPPEPPKAAEEPPGVWLVRSSDAGAVFEARLFPERCFDAMSGAPFTHRVEAELHAGDGATRRFDGCGRFTFEPADGSG